MSGTVYQITQTAAHVCTTLPLAASGFVERLGRWADHWQSLLGSVVGGFGGGVLGLLGAVIVAVMASRRERRIAAKALLPELQAITAAHGALAQVYSYDREENDSGLRNDLLMRRPKLATLYSPAATALYDIDDALSSHLSNCLLYYEAVEGDLAAYQRVLESQTTPGIFGPQQIPKRFQAGDPTRMMHTEHDWDRLAEYAALAAHMLRRLVITRRPRWFTRLGVRLRPTALDRDYAQLMATIEKREQRLAAIST